MNKVEKQPSAILAPVPVVMVSCESPRQGRNIITLAWVGTVCSEPPLLSISIRPGRFSHQIITETKEFVVNVPSREMLGATDYCGVVSGRDVDKFKATGLTPVPGKIVRAPLLAEAPINLECQVKQIISLGSHDLFIAQIVKTHVADTVLDEKGNIMLEAITGIVYGNGQYCQVGSYLGSYGASHQK